MEHSITAYDRVKAARDPARPSVDAYVSALFEDFVEICGDRLGKNDGSILCGIGFFHRLPVTVIGHRKGHTTEENIRFNFGMSGPEGYRKAIRAMKQAEKFGRPVICFVDTPGAYPGIEAENKGQAAAIAESLACLSGLTVPIVSVITGEGGSGGALALAAGDRVYMLENAIYSVLSPEGFAAILWKDAQRAPEAAQAMKLTAEELLSVGICDGIIGEGEALFQNVDDTLRKALTELCPLKTKALLRLRTDRYRRFTGPAVRSQEAPNA
ncbi:MAG: acetyl-CoA carboxylase carboxyl transferase subunit alpha [Firmicutes bacterium]|nr:acetyl-CoA carboxylase carboxyl transferase subunit alpha [Bacillota bacterium]